MTLATLENVLQITDHVPTVIIDLRVLLFEILGSYKVNSDKFTDNPELKKTWMTVKWSIIFNNPLPWLENQPPLGWNVIVVDDQKNPEGTYWRNELLEPNGFPRYKGNRNYADRPETYYELHQSALSYLSNPKCPIPVFRQEGFEADDWAGLACGAKEEDGRYLFLATVDTDWSQLVDDKKQILFASTRNYAPRLRSEYEVFMWAKKKGWLIKDTKEIVDLKVTYGDSADNLEAGSPRSVICLSEPARTPSPAKQRELFKCLTKTEANNNRRHYENAVLWLAKNGLS